MSDDSEFQGQQGRRKGYKKLCTKGIRKLDRNIDKTTPETLKEVLNKEVPISLATPTVQKKPADDDDFVEAAKTKKVLKQKQKSNKRKVEPFRTTSAPVKKKKKEEDISHKSNAGDAFECTQIKISPKLLADMVANLSKEQKEWVRRAGFGHLLEFTVTELPHKLGYKILQAFDHASVSLRLSCGQIFIREEDVADVLGLPIGPIKIETPKNNEIRTSWREQFNVSGHKITASAVCQRIKNSSTVDNMFKLNFLVIMTNTLIHSLGNPYVDQQIVSFEGNLDETSEYNWCSLVIDSLIDSKTQWAENPKTKFYQGPLTFLVLLYVDRVLYKGKRTVERKIPSFLGWTSILLRQRQNDELRSNSFGMGELEISHPSKKLLRENDNRRGKSHVEVDSESDNENIEVDCIKQLEKNFSKYIQSKTLFESSLSLAQKVIPSNPRLNEIMELAENLTGGKASEHEQTMQSPLEKTNTPVQTDDADIGFTQILDTDENFRAKVLEAVATEEASALKTKEDRPSFSLKVTQACTDIGITDLTPHTKHTGKAKRSARPAVALRSPYIDRVSDIKKKPCEDEQQVWDWLTSCEKDPLYVAFKWNDIEAYVSVIETLRDNTQVECGVIDIWTHLLNNNEERRSDVSPRRLFVPPTLLLYTLHDSEGSDEEKRWYRFEANLKGHLEMHTQANLEDLDMVLFTIVAFAHYYVVCYNLKAPAWEIIDNSSNYPDFDAKYQRRPEGLHKNFVRYLKSIQHPKTDEIEKLRPSRLEMKWRTSSNHEDCGIFTMRHLETYMGGGTKAFNTGLLKEGVKQRHQIKRLRSIYTFKILTWDHNAVKDDILWKAVDFVATSNEKGEKVEAAEGAKETKGGKKKITKQ